jgi:hypothetical protein
MARRGTVDQREAEIQAVMDELGLDRDAALIVLGLRIGEVFNDGGLASVRPLSEEERRRLGLGRRPEDVLAELGELDDEPR